MSHEVVLPPQSEAFYNDERLQFGAFMGVRGGVVEANVDAPLSVPLVNNFSDESGVAVAIAKNIRELYGSLTAITVDVAGEKKVIELGVIRRRGSDRAILRSGTYSSSLLANIGNGWETAREAFFNPHKTVVYVGAPGIGLTSALSSAERDYLRRYGSLMDVDPHSGKAYPLPHIQAVNLALREMDVTITDLRSDSAGALVTEAYGTAYGNGNIRTAHHNVRPGVRDIGAVALAYGMQHVDRVVSNAHAKISPDVLMMSQQKKQFTLGHIPEYSLFHAFRPHRSVPTLYANLIGLGRGPEAGDPLIEDASALVKANPDMKLLFTFGNDDPLVRHTDFTRLHDIVRRVSINVTQPVYAVALGGISHNLQTHYPQQLHGIATYLW